ncbi:MAG: 6-phosphogluconolactonase [Nanoarchaeota archaeon]|nr:6-phosphogluconolactonase [Nanoarchaeota archaeon]
MIETVFLKDVDELSNKAADIIEKSVNSLLLNQEKVVLAVPGGRSVAGIFNHLKEKNISWNKVHIFIVDERLVTIDDPESNFRLAKECFLGELIDKGVLPSENVHPFIVDSGIANYEEELKNNGGKYDIILLSSGEDGHVGALYPEHDSIKNDSDFFISMDNSPKPPPNRMSASLKLLTNAKIAILLFFGEGKKDAYRKFLDKDIDVSLCPAKLISNINESYVLTNIDSERL